MPTDDTVLELARELSVVGQADVVVASSAAEMAVVVALTTGGQQGDASTVDTDALRVKLTERGAVLGYPFAVRAGE